MRAFANLATATKKVDLDIQTSETDREGKML